MHLVLGRERAQQQPMRGTVGTEFLPLTARKIPVVRQKFDFLTKFRGAIVYISTTTKYEPQ